MSGSGYDACRNPGDDSPAAGQELLPRLMLFTIAIHWRVCLEPKTESASCDDFRAHVSGGCQSDVCAENMMSCISAVIIRLKMTALPANSHYW